MKIILRNTLALALVVVLISSCASPGGNDTGSEFMPDMYHSLAYEANLYDYYGFNTFSSEEEYKKWVGPRHPVEGTIPRGYAGKASPNGIAVPSNGFVPYYYDNTEEERARATAELINNPFPITKKGLETGKELYTYYCGICHGDKGDGNGYLIRDDGGVYPAQPTSMITDELIESSNGRYYHAIMYGKNVMGAYSDKLSYEERWQVIHYIRALQAAEKKVKYDADVNELTAVEIPGNTLASNVMEVSVDQEEEETSEDAHSEDNHDDSHH